MSKFIGSPISNGKFISITNTTSGNSITATGITFHNSILIPANTFNPYDGTNYFFTIEGVITKTGTNGTFTPLLYVNTANTINNATLIASGSPISSTAQFALISRKCTVTDNRVFGTSALNPSPNDTVFSILGIRYTFIGEWDLDQYVILAARKASSLDSTVGQWLKLSTF
jgi:hypothetical protein